MADKKKRISFAKEEVNKWAKVRTVFGPKERKRKNSYKW